MKTIIVDVTSVGATIRLQLAAGRRSGQVVLVLPDDVQLAPFQDKQEVPHDSSSKTGFQEYGGRNEFPPRRLTEQAILQILREHKGPVRIRDSETGWNIYDEIAAKLGVSVEARRRVTEGTGEPAWRPEVGYCRKNLEQAGILEPTEARGRGVWILRRPA